MDVGTLKRILDSVYGSRYQFLNDEGLARINDANNFYAYYNLGDNEYGTGQYWSMPRNIGYTPTVMPINLARWFVKKRSAWMFEVAPDIECPSETVDSVEDMGQVGYEPSQKQKRLDSQASSREQMLYKIWRENNFEEKLLAGALDYFVGGTVALKIRYIPGKGIRLNFSPTQEVFPVPDDDEPDKFKEISFVGHKDSPNFIWKQTWKMYNGRCYLSEGTYSTNNLMPDNIIYANVDTGLDFIPVVIFPNEALSGDLFGTSMLRDLMPMFDQYNRSMSDAADGLRFNLFAVTVLLNAAPDAEKQLKIAPNELWNIGGDGVDAKKLESSFNYSAALADFLTRLENVMHLIGEVPDITPDRIKGFGLVSGVALKLLYSDLVSATQRAWRIWKSRLVTTNECILKMLEVYEPTKGYPYEFKISDIKGNYENRVIPHLPLPEDDAAKVQLEVNRLVNRLQSVKGALQDLGEKYPEKKIAEMLTEQERFGQAGGADMANKLQNEANKMLKED
jgi:hypothetical protein